MDRQAFYRSRAWQSFRKTYISKQLASGELICARCGQPIVKPFDCILHHKEHLTDANFTDARVALNPANIEPLHMKCHNLEHAKGFGFTGERKRYIVYGPPSAPLVEWVKGVANDTDLIVSVDELYKAIGVGRSKKLLPAVIGLRDKLIEDIRTNNGRWQDSYVIGGYPALAERERLAERLGAELIYIPGEENNEPFVKEWFDIYRRTSNGTDEV